MTRHPKIKEMAKKYNKPEDELLLRLDGRVEWVCDHGVGHTVFSSNNYYVHGCDGCCIDLKELVDD